MDWSMITIRQRDHRVVDLMAAVWQRSNSFSAIYDVGAHCDQVASAATTHEDDHLIDHDERSSPPETTTKHPHNRRCG
jgi:hypothetical protein